MVFSSGTFLFIFLPIVLLIYFNPIFKSRGFKNIFLLLASLAFYAWGEPVNVLIMIASIIVNWGFGHLIKNGKSKKTVVIFAAVYNLSILFVFKYLNFTLKNISLLTGNQSLVTSIALPIGISFFTFQALSYVIDVARGHTNPQDSILDVGLYIACFPQLIAGPIVRYETIALEINNRQETFEDFSSGMNRFIFGLAKKVIIANNMALVADAAFGTDERSVAAAWLGALAYSLQIYFDFSGYSDMAIGLGKIFGFHFLENFNYPYIAKSVTDFWHRWHISLSTWFRDYVYFPLGGSRVKSAARHIFNLGVVWLLTGMWHGANWTFIMWGIVYFLVQVFEKFVLKSKPIPVFGHIYTLLIVMFCWVLFRANSIGDAFTYIGTMFGVGASGLSSTDAVSFISQYWVYFISGIVLSLPIFPKIMEKFGKAKPMKIIYPIFTVLLFMLTITFVVSSSYDPFIYFNF